MRSDVSVPGDNLLVAVSRLLLVHNNPQQLMTAYKDMTTFSYI
jgi:hypothetical protein